MSEQDELKSMICSKCGKKITGMGSLQSKIVDGKLMHIVCPVSKQDELLLTPQEIDALWLEDSRDWGLRVAEAQLAKDKQRIKELEGELEREKFHHQFAEDVIEDMKKEK